MARVILTIVLLLFCSIVPGYAQSSFQVPVTVIAGGNSTVNLLGINPGNSIGVDRDTLLHSFLEEASSPLPPPPFDLDARWVTIPGRTITYPVGLGGGVARDFRDFHDTAQVDTFRLLVQGEKPRLDTTVISWPGDLARYASSWHIKSLGTAVLPETDMLSTPAVKIVPDQINDTYNFLIIKNGARPAKFPAGCVSTIIFGGDGVTVYPFDRGYHQWDTSNNAALSMFFPFGNVQPGSVTATFYRSAAVNAQFGGTPPAHTGGYRWVITGAGLKPFGAVLEFEPFRFPSGVKNKTDVTVFRRDAEGTGLFSPIAQHIGGGLENYVAVDATSFGEFIFGADYPLTSVSPQAAARVPAEVSLEQNFPNPFNPATNIRYEVPRDGYAVMKVYSMLGQEVSTLVDGPVHTGGHTVSFNGSHLASGIYLCRLTFQASAGSSAGFSSLTRKMLLVK